MKGLGIAGAVSVFMVIAAGAPLHAQSSHDQSRRGQQSAHPAPVPATVQHQRAQQQQQRATQYKTHIAQQVPVMQKQTAQLHAENRTAQYRVQQQYTTKVRQQAQQVTTNRNYAAEPYVKAPATYRYTISGNARETNSYGVTMLRQSVNDGYQQGYLSGRADRSDRWKSDYQNSPAYLDANYGYTGNYIDQSDYNYYFREGFQRGYEDGYNSRLQYGTSSNGSYSILSAVLNGILGLQSIR